MDFIVDTIGDDDLQVKSELLDENDRLLIDDENKTEAILALFEKKKEELDKVAMEREEVHSKLKGLKIDSVFEDFFSEMGWNNSIIVKKVKKKKKLFHFEQLDIETGNLKSKLGSVNVDKEMEKSVLQPGLEKKNRLPRYDISDKRLKALRRKQREKTKGPGWFDMKAPAMTEELTNDLQVLKMRSVMDPKHFYKKNDMEVLPKYFQVGRIEDSALDHVNERLTRKERKRTMVDELLADVEFQKYNKKKYKEIIEDKRKTEYRTFMRDKRQKNKTELKKTKLKSKKNAQN
ncbi:unnamed protein product, partial [Iphiclides podalirius]